MQRADVEIAFVSGGPPYSEQESWRDALAGALEHYGGTVTALFTPRERGWQLIIFIWRLGGPTGSERVGDVECQPLRESSVRALRAAGYDVTDVRAALTGATSEDGS